MKSQQAKRQPKQQKNNDKNKSNSVYSAFDTAAYYLSFKDRTVEEIRKKLEEKEYDAYQISDAIEKLIYYRYLDDKKYAMAYIRCNCKKKGIKLIKSELLAKGIERNLLSEVLESMDFDTDDELDAVRNIYDHRFSDLDLKDVKQKKKVYSYFQRRGFSYDSITKAIG